MMQNNPLAQLMAAMQTGRDPMAMMQQLAGTDPRIAQALRLINGRDPQQLRQMAQNMAKERGVNIEDVARSLGIGIPSQR